MVLESLLYERLISGTAIIVLLAMITGGMVSLLIAGLFYAVYSLLVRHGMEPDVAFLTVGAEVAAVAAIAGAFTVSYIKKLRRALRPLSSFTSGIMIANAFVDGLLTQPAKETERNRIMKTLKPKEIMAANPSGLKDRKNRDSHMKGFVAGIQALNAYTCQPIFDCGKKYVHSLNLRPFSEKIFPLC